MKKIILILLLIGNTCFSQIITPVTWENSIEKITDTEYNLVFVAIIKKDWHLYALNLPNGGPLPTVFSFDKNSSYKLIGDMIQEKGITEYEEIFEMDVTYFSNKTTFKQRIKTKEKKLKITGNIDYMACSNEKCIPAYDEFKIKL